MNYYNHDIRIRYAETDQMGVCYYANYFVWFESARTEYFRALGLPYTEYEKKGIFLPVGEAFCRYYKPLKYDDFITVKTWIPKLKQTSIQFSYEIRKKDDDILISEGHTKHIFVNENMKPQKIPNEIREKVNT